jgi:NAD(P)H-flavin reductase
MGNTHIKKVRGTITKVRDLSPTAREITILPSEAFPFIAGSFVNVFFQHETGKIRRAFSISSDDTETGVFTLSIRLSPKGMLTPLFWNDSIVGTELELMGPLGLNTADALHSETIFLFGFGIGAGVIKSIAQHVVRRPTLSALTIITGSRSDDDMVHKDFFDTLAENDPRVRVSYVVSSPLANSLHLTGYIQNHLAEYDFTNADVYVCGQEVACAALVETVTAHQPENCHFFIEAFH